MRIALVYPYNPVNPEKEPPMGLAMIASSLRKKFKPVISVLDSRIRKYSISETAKKVIAFNSDMVGMTGTAPEGDAQHELASELRKLGFKGPVFSGGAYASCDPERLLGDINIDAAVIGEGEISVVKMVEALSKGQPPVGIPGVAYREGEKIVVPENREFIQDVDSIPLPSWDLFDLGAYWKVETVPNHHFDMKYLSIFTSRGCTASCTFCHNIFGRGYRPRSVESVLHELEWLQKSYGIIDIHVYDDAFSGNMERAKLILEGMLKRKLKTKLKFSIGLRIDQVDEELIDLFARTGVYYIAYGVESATPRIRQAIGKPLDDSRVEHIIRSTAARGIHTHGLFMLGFAGESETEMKNTVDMACRLPFSTVTFSSVIPFPGTPMAVETGAPTGTLDNWHFAQSRVTASGMEENKFRKIKLGAYRRFYADPRRIYRYLKHLPDLSFPPKKIALWAYMRYVQGKKVEL